MTVPSTLKELGNEMGLDLSTMLIPSSQVSGNLGGGTDNTPTYTIYKTGANFAARANVAGLTDVAANADAAVVLQSAMDNINGSTTPRGLIIFAPNTTFTWNSIPSMRRTYASGGNDDNKWLRILGSGGSVIQFAGVNSTEFMHFNRQADYDGFCGIEIGFLDFDGNNIVASGSTVLGNVGSVQRADFRRVWVHDCNSYNNVTHTLASGLIRFFCNISCTQLLANETQNVMLDFRFERCRIIGGHCAIAITAGSAGGSAQWPGTKVYGDRWYVSDIYFDNNVAASAQSTLPPSSCIQLGSIAWGDRMVIERCWLAGSADDGIEVNNFRRVLVRDCHVSKCLVGGYAPVQFNYVNGADNLTAPSQEYVFENCFYEHVAGMEASSTDRAFVVTLSGLNSVDSGTYLFRNCVSYCSAKLVDNAAQLGGAFYIAGGFTNNIDRIILEDCAVDHWYDASGGKDVRPIWFYRMGRQTVIRDLKMVIRGAQISSTYALKALFLNGIGKARLDIDGITIDDQTTGRTAGLTQILFLGNDTSNGTNDFGGTIRRLVQLASGDTSVQMIWIAQTSTLTLRKLLIEDCDSSRLAASAEDVKFQTAGQNEAPVFIRNMKGRVDPPVEITFTPGASTVSAQYLGHYEGLMTLTGGTVTVIEVSTDNATFRQVGTTTPASFYIDHGMYVRMTYTVVPTAKVIPRR